MKTNLFTTLIDKLPAVRRLRAEIQQWKDHAAADKAFREEMLKRIQGLEKERETLALDKRSVSASLDVVTIRRNQLQREHDDLRVEFTKQSATIREQASLITGLERLIAEQKPALDQARDREARLFNTIDSLNSTLRERDAELDDVRAEMKDARAEVDAARAWRRQATRPVLFRREAALPEERVRAILAGQSEVAVVKAMVQVLDECAVSAMSEAAGAPMAPVTDGPHAARGYTAEDRTFSAGGVYALTELKRRLAEKLEPAEQEAKAA